MCQYGNLVGTVPFAIWDNLQIFSTIILFFRQNRKMKGLKETRKADKAEKVAQKKEKAEAARKRAVGAVFGEKDAAAAAAEGDNDVTMAVTG
jgi:hypothetical protein